MAWSTREVAELAGTSLRAVRHYHEVGLLPEPQRRSNGYKSYGVDHLVRLLRIKRLVDLGLSLPQIAELGDADEHPEDALRALDAELGATIERLQQARAEVAQLLDSATPTELPPELAAVAGAEHISATDRSLITVLARVLSPAAVDSYREMLRVDEPTPEDAEFAALPDDAAEDVRRDLAARMAPAVRALYAEYPHLREHDPTPGGQRRMQRAIGVAMRELYNSAQLDVLRRLGAELRE